MVGDRVHDLRDHAIVVVFRFDSLTQCASWCVETSLSDARPSLHLSVYRRMLHAVWNVLPQRWVVACLVGLDVDDGIGGSDRETLLHEVLQRWRVVLFAGRLGTGLGDTGVFPLLWGRWLHLDFHRSRRLFERNLVLGERRATVLSSDLARTRLNREYVPLPADPEIRRWLLPGGLES